MDEKELSLASMKSELRRVEEEHEKILYSEKEAVKVIRNNFHQILNCELRQGSSECYFCCIIIL